MAGPQYYDPAIPQPPQGDFFAQFADIQRRLEALEHHEHTTQVPGALALGGNVPGANAAVGFAGVSGNAAKDDHYHQGLLLGSNVPGPCAATGAAGTSVNAAHDDHHHQGLLLGSNVPGANAATGSTGTSINAARDDHRHQGLLLNSYYANVASDYGDIYNSGGVENGSSSTYAVVQGAVNLSAPGASNNSAFVTCAFCFEVSSASVSPFAFGYLFVDHASPAPGLQQNAQASFRPPLGGAQGLRVTVSQTWNVLGLAQGAHTFLMAVTATSVGMTLKAVHSTISIVILG